MPYEFDGEKYEKASSHQKEWGSRLIPELDLQGDERIRDRVVAQMIRATRREDGGCFETFRRINVYARKHG